VIKETTDKAARDLVRVLNDLIQIHGEMAELMKSELEAIKHADCDRLQSVTAREMALADRAFQRESLRKQITRKIVEGLGLEWEENQNIRLADLAEYFPEPRRSQLLVAATGLRNKLSELERLRVTNTLVTQEMLKHLNELVSVMKAGTPAADIYSRTGCREQVGTANVFEAVG